MKLFQLDRKGRWQGFAVNCRKRNWVTDVFLYGIQIAAVLYSLVMVAEMIDMICDFREPYPLSCYEDLTIRGLIFRMLSKGWLVGLGIYIVVIFCNLSIYYLSLFLPKRVVETNITTIQQCQKPSNWLITLSFIVMLMWCIMLFDTIC